MIGSGPFFVRDGAKTTVGDLERVGHGRRSWNMLKRLEQDC